MCLGVCFGEISFSESQNTSEIAAKEINIPIVSHEISKGFTNTLILKGDSIKAVIKTHSAPSFKIKAKLIVFPKNQEVIIKKSQNKKALILDSSSPPFQIAGEKLQGTQVEYEIYVPVELNSLKANAGFLQLELEGLECSVIVNAGKLALTSKGGNIQVFEGKAGQGDITIERISKDLKIACGMATISANYDLKEYFQKKESAKLGFRKPIVIDIKQGAGNTTLSFPSKTQMSYWKAANVKSPFSNEKKGYDVRILFQAPPEASSLEIKKQAE